jgi:hypothetical protein
MAGIEDAPRPFPPRRMRPSKGRLTAIERRELEVLQQVHDMCREPDEWAHGLWPDRPDADTDEEFDALLEESSLGSPIAKHVRGLSPDTDEENP